MQYAKAAQHRNKQQINQAAPGWEPVHLCYYASDQPDNAYKEHPAKDVTGLKFLQFRQVEAFPQSPCVQVQQCEGEIRAGESKAINGIQSRKFAVSDLHTARTAEDHVIHAKAEKELQRIHIEHDNKQK